MRRILVFLFCLCSASPVQASKSMLAASRYFFSHSQYEDALKIGRSQLHKDPTDLEVLFPVLELTLLVEGREALQTHLMRLVSKYGDTLSLAKRLKLKNRVEELQSVFTTDVGQTKYFQARASFEKKDYELAWSLLNESNQQENGNIQVLLLKEACEERLEKWETYYETLQTQVGLNPFHIERLVALAEADLYFGYPSRAIEKLDTLSYLQLNERAQLLLAMAYLDSSQNRLALRTFGTLFSQRTRLPPIAYFGFGKSLSISSRTRPEAHRYLKMFTSRVSEDAELGWDPYRVKERLKQAKALLATAVVNQR